MNDVQIRAHLHERIGLQFADDPDTLVVDELGIDEGSYRADVVAINGALHGFEIKSARDSLTRLAAQSVAYGRVFDVLTIVTADRHLERVLETVPDWWGVVVVDSDTHDPLREYRPPGPNPTIDAFAVAQLLWRDEAFAALQQYDLAAGLQRRPRRELWSALAAGIALADLQALVRDQLRARRTWRADPTSA